MLVWMITGILGIMLKILHAEPAFMANGLIAFSFFVLVIAIIKLVTRYDKLPS